MALELKQGTVKDTTDPTNSGRFSVDIGLVDPVWVHYVSPYGNSQAAMVALPPVGSIVLLLREKNVTNVPASPAGYYYLGSVLDGATANSPYPGFPSEEENLETVMSEGYTPSDQPGLNSPLGVDTNPDPATGLPPTPVTPRLKKGPLSAKSFGMWPTGLKNLYSGRAVVPMQMGMTTEWGDSLIFSNRNTSNTEQEPGTLPFQDHRISLQTGKGKNLRLVDSPTVNGLVYSNESKGLDYFMWSSGSNPNSPFSRGEYHMRTRGPVNLYTLWSSFNIWVQEGRNINITNKSANSKASPDFGPRNSDGRVDAEGNPSSGKGDPSQAAGGNARIANRGNETTGCINIRSLHNNVNVQAYNNDSVIYVNTPGPNSRVIVDSGGTVDINAKGKVTIQSQTEVEINAPLVDINSEGKVTIDGSEVRLNDSGAGASY